MIDLVLLRDEIIADKQGFADRKIAELEQLISTLPIRQAESCNISMRTHLIRMKSAITADPIAYADSQISFIESAIADIEAVTNGD